METSAKLKEVTIYTDGACIGNPGRGGYGVVLLYDSKHRRELAGGYALTTNNRMELMAAIVGLEALKEPCKVVLHSDSQYLVGNMNKGSVRRWQANDWWRNPNRTTRAINPDLWGRLLVACERHVVEFIWVRGHAGTAENERCDRLSVGAAKSPGLPHDEGYQPKSERPPIPIAPPADRKTKLTREGQPCRACGVPVIKKTPTGKHRPDQEYYFEYYLSCPGCGNMYMILGPAVDLPAQSPHVQP